MRRALAILILAALAAAACGPSERETCEAYWKRSNECFEAGRFKYWTDVLKKPAFAYRPDLRTPDARGQCASGSVPEPLRACVATTTCDELAACEAAAGSDRTR